MDCRICEEHLADVKELFFFVKSPKEVSLVVKPEFKAILEGSVFVRVQESKKKTRIKCRNCCNDIGRGLPFGPNGIEFLAFGPEKIIFCGNKLSGKQKWSELMLRFQHIDCRNLENFFGERIVGQDDDLKDYEDDDHIEIEPVKFASTLNDFEWFSLTPRKPPRSYQIDAYVEALQQNLIVVIETGLGKTLIATMVIARMKLLNPDRMAVVLVDRIPLVFQQGQAIMMDTNLRVCRLCSENRTKRRVKQLHDGTYDVLVITAGSFLEMLNRKQVQISDFCVIVFDECHHATGNHVYTKVLLQIQSCLGIHKPRVLGLTASPFKVENLVKGRNQLAKFQRTFLGASFFYPVIERPENETEQVTFSCSGQQNDFITDAISVIQTVVDGINKVVKGYCNSKAIKHSSLNHLKGDIKALLAEYPDSKNLQVIAKDVLFLTDVIEVCELLGISHAVAILEQSDNLPFDIQGLRKKYGKLKGNIAPRMKELERCLESCSADTRAIVFVQTQLSARRILDHLVNKFPELNPRMVIGHGGQFGMTWEDEQKPVLKDFKDGKTKLLVATSVLEEGLDVAQCDLVIRYSGPNTLTNFIQSRGRARKSGSKFYVFVDSEYTKSTHTLKSQELILKHLIHVEGVRDRLPSEKSKRIIERLKREIPAKVYDGIPKKPVEEVDIKGVVVVEFFVRMQSDELDLRHALVTEIEENDIFTVHRLCPTEQGGQAASGTAGVFSNRDRAFIVSLKSELDDTRHAYECFCRQWDFELTALTSDKDVPRVWCKYEMTAVDVNEAQVEWRPNIVEFGKFTSQQTFESSAKFCKRMENILVLPWDNHCYELVLLEFEIGKGILLTFNFDVSVLISLKDLNNFALISTESRKLCLYIPYKYAPLVSRPGLDGRRIIVCSDDFLGKTVAENSVMAVHFEPSLFQNLYATLSLPAILPVPLFSTRMKHDNLYDLEHTLQTTMSRVEADPSAGYCTWLLKALSSRKDVCIPNKTLLYLYQQLETILKEEANKLTEFEIALTRVVSSNSSYWKDLQEVFDKNFESLSKLPSSSFPLVKTPIPKNHVLIKRILVTPKRVICLPATPVASSRLLRNYGDLHEFVIVSFREEQFQKLENTNAMERVRGFIMNGIAVTKRYWFFCASASQLRDHKAYFVAANSYSEAQHLRSRIVTNKDFKSTAKFLSRVGLFGTADRPTVSVAEGKILRQPDMEARNGDLVTDGCGKISRDLAQKIRDKLEPDEPLPSAYQIRFKGIKGVVLVVSDDDTELNGADVLYRDSMRKFDNDDESFCVVGKAKFIKLYLNREVITLLTSIHRSSVLPAERYWPVENAIIDMHEKAICDAATIFEDASTARVALMEYLPKTLLKQVVDSGFDLLIEKFWFSLLRHVYRLSVISLRNKSRIPVDDGCLVMGVADPTGILKDDEIFLQIEEDEEKPRRIVTGRVLMYRNPCLHPGDLHWVTAVDHVALRQWVNVVILPTLNTSFSLAAACSGGDLDGDLFAVIWDPRFMIPDGNQHKPLNYSELAEGAPEYYNPEYEAALFSQLYFKIMKNDALGRVAHTHLALCDILPKGACDPCAMELAKSQSQAVDFPKTGIIPLVPKAALIIVRGNGYPDFMEKGSGYESSKLLGILYRRCRSVMFDFEILTEKRLGYQSSFDFELIVDGNDAYIDDAKEKFKMYKKSLKSIMVHYSLKREAEVVLGRPLHWDPLLKADKGSVSTAITKSYEALVQKYREEFFRNVVNQEEVRKKASAWYRVSYDNRFSQMDSNHIYSFAWVVYDILCGLKRERKSTQVQRPNTVLLQIGASIFEELLDRRSHLESIIASRENVLRCVRAEIVRLAGQDAFEVTSYGSVSMYLCEEESDLDVCLVALDNAWRKLQQGGLIRQQDATMQARSFLEMIITHALDEIANEKIHKLQAKVPLISIKVGDAGNETKVDVSFNRIGKLKTDYMHALYSHNRHVFPLFWILVRWARSIGLIKSGVENKGDTEEDKQSKMPAHGDGRDAEGLIASAEFYALVINLLEFRVEKEQEKARGRSKKGATKRRGKEFCPLSKLFERASRASKEDKIKVADMLVTFFRRGSVLDKDIELDWFHKEIPKVPLSQQVVKLIATHCMNALHCILATRNMNTMLSSIRDTDQHEISYSKRLSNTLVNAMGNAQSFHATRLSKLTGANVKIKDDRIVIATGTRLAIMRLKEELHNLSVTNRALMLGRLPRKSSRYFMEGATLIIMKKNSSSDAVVTLEESEGPWNMLHNVVERHHPKLKSEQNNDWYEIAIDRMSERLLQQVHKLKVPIKNNAAVSESLSVSILFGCFYTVDKSRCIPISQPNITVGDLEFKIEKGRRNRKQWQRGEFVQSPDKDEEYRGMKVRFHSPEARDEESLERKKKEKKQKSSIASSFCAGILAKNSRDAFTIESCVKFYKSALEECGFHQGSNGYIRDKEGWKVHCWPSTSYEVCLRLDDQMMVDCVEEHALKWMCVNFLDGDKQEVQKDLLVNSDVRINIVTKDPVKKSSDLYKKLVPRPYQRILEVKHGKPIISEDYPSKASISNIQHVHNCLEFCKENFDAVITQGTTFRGKDFKVSRVFCDLTLRYNPSDFRDFVTSELDVNKCREFADKLCRNGLNISHALQQ